MFCLVNPKAPSLMKPLLSQIRHVFGIVTNGLCIPAGGNQIGAKFWEAPEDPQIYRFVFLTPLLYPSESAWPFLLFRPPGFPENRRVAAFSTEFLRFVEAAVTLRMEHVGFVRAQTGSVCSLRPCVCVCVCLCCRVTLSEGIHPREWITNTTRDSGSGD